MSKQTFLSRFSLIIKRLERGPASFIDLKTYLEKESDINEKNFNLSIRTLQRDIKHIHEQFDIKIVNERKADKRYLIKHKSENTEHTIRLLEAYDMLNIVKSSKQDDRYVFFESRKPKGLEHFTGLLYACRNKKILTFRHHKFWDDNITHRTVHPLALKEARGRWYLLAIDIKDGNLRSFGLDRIEELEISKTSFREKYTIDIAGSFRYAFGIINEANQKPQKVQLLLSHEQGQYLLNYPLHHSQHIIGEDTGGDIKLELNLKISYDFVMELLSYGETVRVLSPKSLVKLLVSRNRKMIEMYDE